MAYKLRPIQKAGAAHIVAHRRSALWLGMGVGKTLTTLDAISRLRLIGYHGNRVLVLAPKRVAVEVWPDEIRKWGLGMSHKVITGESPKARLSYLTGELKDITLMGYELLPWLDENIKRIPFDTIVLDEADRVKNPSAKSSKALRRILRRMDNPRIIQLTGTPAAQSYVDLWHQVFLLDDGRRLGNTKTSYVQRYFTTFDMGGFQSKPILNKGAAQKIQNAVKDICFSADSSGVPMPEMVISDVDVHLPNDARKYYEDFMAGEIDEGIEDVMSAGALFSKALQISSGGLYVGEGSERQTLKIHRAKLDLVRETLEELNGATLLIGYNFEFEREWLREEFGAVDVNDHKDTVRLWNEGKIPVLMGHPKSMGHGLNMQFGGNNVLWFSLPTSRALYDQFNARLVRPGSTAESVYIRRLVTVDTEEDRVVRRNLETNGAAQADMLKAVQSYWKEKYAQV